MTEKSSLEKLPSVPSFSVCSVFFPLLSYSDLRRLSFGRQQTLFQFLISPTAHTHHVETFARENDLLHGFLAGALQIIAHVHCKVVQLGGAFGVRRFGAALVVPL